MSSERLEVNIDNEHQQLIMIGILGLLEEGNHISQVCDLIHRIAGEVWHGLVEERINEQE